MGVESDLMHQERRRQKRHSTSCPLRVQVLSTSSPIRDEHPFPATAQDVAPNGICFYFHLDIPVGTELIVRVRTETIGHYETWITHRGVVRWTQLEEANNRFRIGVELVDTAADQMAPWYAFVGESMPMIF